MKYVVIRIRKTADNCEWKCMFASNNQDEAIQICNEYNRLDENSRYTVYQEYES